MRRPVAKYNRISSQHGEPIRGSRFGKHLGCDYSIGVGNRVEAPVSGTVTLSYYSNSIGHTVEIREDGNGRLHRFAHMQERMVSVNQHVNEGQAIGATGDTGTFRTGPHCHWDCRKAGTRWDESFDNYYDVEDLLAAANQPKPSGHPLAWTVGRLVHLKPIDSAWRVYAPGSAAPRKKVATLNPKRFGGLTYRVLATERALNSVLIETDWFGKVSLPIAKNNKGTLYSDCEIR